jgi:transposase
MGGGGITVSIKRRAFSKEFKLHVIGEVESGKPASQVAREYQLHPNLISRWRSEYEAYADEAFAGFGEAYTDKARAGMLERKIARLEAENELLKKALTQLDAIRNSEQGSGDKE